MIPVIAIDGPSGVGKGTAARAVAQRLRWHFLDSGALYRILGLAAKQRGIALTDAAAVAALAPNLDIRFVAKADDSEQILLGGTDIAALVRTEKTM